MSMSLESPQRPTGAIISPSCSPSHSLEGVFCDDDSVVNPVFLRFDESNSSSPSREEDITRLALPILLIIGQFFKEKITFSASKAPLFLLPIFFFRIRRRKGFLNPKLNEE